jgi:peptidase E
MSGLLKMVITGGNNPIDTTQQHFEAGLALATAKTPNVLVIPSACPNSNSFQAANEGMRRMCMRRKVNVKILHRYSGKMPSYPVIAKQIQWADIVCILDGNTRRMMSTWKDMRLIDLLTEAAHLGEVAIIGFGSGMLAWFDEGLSASDMYGRGSGEPWDYRPVSCTGYFAGALACPRFETVHPLTKVRRALHFRDLMREHPTGTVGIGLDTHAGLRIYDGEATVLSSGKNGSLYHHVTTSPTAIDVKEFKPGTTMPLRQVFTPPA